MRRRTERGPESEGVKDACSRRWRASKRALSVSSTATAPLRVFGLGARATTAHGVNFDVHGPTRS